MNRTAFLLTILIMAVAVGSCSKGSGPKYSGVYGEAMQAIDEYRFPVADSLLAEAAKTDSTSFEGSYVQGISLERQFLFEDALQSYLLTASRYPDSANVYGALCRAYTALESPIEAADMATRWLQRESGNSEAHGWNIRSNIEAGLYPQAELALDEGKKNGLDASVAALLQARLQVISEQYDDAAKVAAQAQSGKSSSPFYYLALADYLDQAGLIDSAIKAAQQSYESGKDTYYGYLYFQRCLKHKYFSAARGIIADLAKRDRSQIPSAILLVRYKATSGDLSQMTRMADQVLVRCPGRYGAHLTSLLARWAVGDLQMANDDVAQIRTKFGEQGVYPPFKQFMRWQILVYNRWPYSPKEVMEDLDSLRGWREALPRYQAMAAGRLLADSTRDRFNACVDSLLNANAGSPYWLSSLGAVFSEAPGEKHAIGNKVYRFVLSRYPQSMAARYGLMQNMAIDHDYGAALAAYMEAPAFGTHFPEALLLKALCEAKLGKVSDAVASFNSCYSLLKGNVAGSSDIVQELLRRQNKSEAEQILSQCLQAEPSDADFRLLASDVDFKMGNFQGSLDEARKGLALEPDYRRLKALEARALFGVGKKEEATKEFDDLLKKLPTDPDACLYYSRILADENTSLDRAQNMARIAMGFSQLSQKASLNLAYVYVKSNRYDLALAAAQQAVLIYPDDPEAFYYLGWTQYLAKRPGAKENLEKGIALGLTGDQLQTARETLAKL